MAKKNNQSNTVRRTQCAKTLSSERSKDAPAEKLTEILDNVFSDGTLQPSTIAIRISQDVQSIREYWNKNVSVSDDSPHKKIYDAVLDAALTNLPILLFGPSGCGKTHIAKTIFKIKALRFFLRETIEETEQNWRTKIPERFHELNCTGLRGNTIQSMLFGHVRGAFTDATADKEGIFALANGGVLFLDEIGELDLITQAMLLKTIEEKKFTRVGGRGKHADNRFSFDLRNQS